MMHCLVKTYKIIKKSRKMSDKETHHLGHQAHKHQSVLIDVIEPCEDCHRRSK